MTAPNQAIRLDTSQGTPIPNDQATAIPHPLAAQRLVGRVAFPAVLRVSPHPRYNCHGLTFASRRAAVLADTDVTLIIQEDGYRSIQTPDVLPGDVAIYFAHNGGIDHSAIVVSKPDDLTRVPFVCSKWGVIGPEVVHLATDTTPRYDISDIRYYRCDP